jgi:predicted PurR-regulated permease PerM
MESREVTRRVRFTREAKIITLLILGAFVIWLIWRVGPVLGPFVWAGITAYVFSPLVDWLEMRTRLRRIWVVVLLYLVGLAVTIWVATALVPVLLRQVGGLLRDLPGILSSLVERLASIDRYLLAEQVQIYGFTIDPQMLVNEATRYLQNVVGYVTTRAIPAVFDVLGSFAQVLLYVIATFYLLRAWRSLRSRTTRLIPRPYRTEIVHVLADIDRVLGAYIRGQLLLIGIMSLATFIALSILRVQYSLIIALISGVLEVIPLVGPIAAGGIAVSIALFQPSTPFGWSSLTLALAVVVAYTVLRQIEDQLVVPNLVGPIVDLHPLLVLFALIAGGTLAGFTGLVVAVPAAAALKIIVTYLYHKIWDEQQAEAPPAAASAQAVAEPTGEPS